MKRTFFVDLNKNGIMDYPGCRRRRANGRFKSPCEGDRTSGGKATKIKEQEFTVKDIYTNAATSPAGGVNQEFIDPDGKPCDALNMRKDCKPADAGDMQGGGLIHYLQQFCDTPASLYQVPVGKEDLQVPADFGAVTYPMPICSPAHGQNCTNYRGKARADFGSHGKGTWLQCQTNNCREGTKQSAAQGKFDTRLDKYVSSKSPSDAYTRPWYPLIGGDNGGGNNPSAVTVAWSNKGTKQAGLFNEDVMKNHWQSVKHGAMYAKGLVEAESTRSDGVTCLNGKYVYARKLEKKYFGHLPEHKRRPIVSTVREALNRNGPVASGQWACRYLGVACNANNCNNNGNGEVPGPFVVPKFVPTTTTTTTTIKREGRRRRRGQ